MKVNILTVVLAAVTMWSGVALAQQAPATPADPAALSEVESLRLENLRLKAQLASTVKGAAATQTALSQCEASDNSALVETEAKRLLDDYATAHPGFRLDLSTGKGIKVAADPPAAEAPDKAPGKK